MLENALYIVPTPIGNLSDITYRAVEVLKAATLIAAEDTRHSRIFLDSIGVKNTRMVSCHDHNEAERADLIAGEVAKGGLVALISDAGTPLISDPGFRVVRELAARNVKVIALPGPCAAITALSVAGLPTDRFTFRGFLPVKEQELRAAIADLHNIECTTVFYESPRRVLTTVKMMGELIPEHPLVLCRELTKTFESVYRLKAAEAAAFLEADANRLKGEFVLIVGVPEKTASGETLSPEVVRALEELIALAPVKAVCRALAPLTGLRVNALYEKAMELKERA